MKLAFVSQHFAPHFEGGTEVVVRSQARELALRGHELRILSGTDRPHSGEDLEASVVDGLPVVHLPRLPGEPFDLELERPRIESLVRGAVEGVDLVHLHHWSTLSSGLVRSLKAAGFPVVVSLHDLFVTCPRFFRRSPDPEIVCPAAGEFAACARCVLPDAPGLGEEELLRGFLARSRSYSAELDSAAAVLVPSAAHASALLPFLSGSLSGSMGPSTKVTVVPHGLCTQMERSALDAIPVGERPLRVLHFGHRSEAKGTLDLARAMAALPEGSAVLVLAGSEVDAGHDARLADALGGLEVEFHGKYDPSDLVDLAAGADLAVFPSRCEESYGLVVDEALALGLPVWVSDRGALPERIGEAGRVLPAEDPASWTRAFLEVLTDPEKLERERARVPRGLRTSADAAAELEALYEAVLGATPPSREG